MKDERSRSPFDAYLNTLYEALHGLDKGAIAEYIPELAKAKPSDFAISFATVDGQVYSVGDSDVAFSIQSVSKPFAYAGVLRDLGTAKVLERVGVEPTGEAFNSIVLDEVRNRPFNPMVNAGAIAVASLMPGETAAAREAHMIRLFSSFAGRPLEIDQAVYRSEAETGHRNRAIAYLMLNSGMIEGDPEAVLDLYFKQCALNVTTRDLALMGATLANAGVHPRTGEAVVSPEEVRDVLTLMMSCGMYDYAGEWSFDVGLPAKSGVSGGIVAVLPGQLSVAIWSPPLDEIGNSIRGIEVCRQISKDFGLHLFMNAAPVETVIRRHTTVRDQQSLRVRNPRERDILGTHGDRIHLIELQGALYFASAERTLRTLNRTIDDAGYLVLDVRRLSSIDDAAVRVIVDDLATRARQGLDISIAEIDNARAPLKAPLEAVIAGIGARKFETMDAALEACEDALLETLREPYDHTRFALEEIDLFNGLSQRQCARIADLIVPLHFDAGAHILRAGETGSEFYLVARGTVSILVSNANTSPLRVGCIGPGQFFGEMAMLGQGLRSADVVADDRVVCYALSAEKLNALGSEEPEIVTVIMTNMAREFARRIQTANTIVRSLQ